MGSLMTSCINLRSELNNEIEFHLNNKLDLRPFLSAWKLINNQFNGVFELGEQFDPIFQIHCNLLKELKKTDLITEELFIAWLLQLKIIQVNVVCKDTGDVWQPTVESFEHFKSKCSSSNFFVSDCSDVDEKIKSFLSWIITICDWETSNIYLTNVKLH